MKITDINPYIRFAQEITYTVKQNTVYVRDCRLFYILEGTAELNINQHNIILHKNSVFYCAGDWIYTIKTDEPLKLMVLNFDLSQRSNNLNMPFAPDAVNAAKKNTPTDKCIIQDSSFLNSFLFIENCLDFKGIMADIIKEYTMQKILYREKCSSMLKNLLIEMHRKMLNCASNSSDTVNKVMNYIASNYTKEIKNSTLAEIAGYHEYYLNRLFIRYTGTSMHKYIIHMRLNEAKRLLINTDMPISSAGIAAGFNDNVHFSRYFKQETGMTPSQYRNSFKNKI